MRIFNWLKRKIFGRTTVEILKDLVQEIDNERNPKPVRIK